MTTTFSAYRTGSLSSGAGGIVRVVGGVQVGFGGAESLVTGIWGALLA